MLLYIILPLLLVYTVGAVSLLHSDSSQYLSILFDQPFPDFHHMAAPAPEDPAGTGAFPQGRIARIALDLVVVGASIAAPLSPPTQ